MVVFDQFISPKTRPARMMLTRATAALQAATTGLKWLSMALALGPLLVLVFPVFVMVVVSGHLGDAEAM